MTTPRDALVSRTPARVPRTPARRQSCPVHSPDDLTLALDLAGGCTRAVCLHCGENIYRVWGMDAWWEDRRRIERCILVAGGLSPDEVLA